MACEDFDGITYDGNICCAEQCGECGGNGCKNRPGGKNECCVQRIVEANVSCDEAGSAPCVLTMMSPTPAPATEAPVTVVPATAAPIDATSAPATAAPVAGTLAPMNTVPSTITEAPVAGITMTPTVSEREIIFTTSPTEAIMAPTMLPTSTPTHATIHPSSTPTSAPTMMETTYPTAAPLTVFEETSSPTTGERGFEIASLSPTSTPTSALTPVQPSLNTDAPATTPSPFSGAGQLVPSSGVVYACAVGLLIAVGMLL